MLQNGYNEKILLENYGIRYWNRHERSALQSAAVQVVDWQWQLWTAFSTIFFHHHDSLSQPFLIEQLLCLKILFCKSCQGTQKPRGELLSRPRRPFWGPWRPFLILQAVWRCRQWARAPFAANICWLNHSFDIKNWPYAIPVTPAMPRTLWTSNVLWCLNAWFCVHCSNA